MKRFIFSVREAGMYKSTFMCLVVLIALCGGLCCRPASAGYWEVHWNIPSKVNYASSNLIEKLNEQGNMSSSLHPEEYYTELPVSGDGSVYGSGSASLTWIPDYVGDIPPDKVIVELAVFLGATESVVFGNGLPEQIPPILDSLHSSFGQQEITPDQIYDTLVNRSVTYQGKQIVIIRTGSRPYIHLETKPNFEINFRTTNVPALNIQGFQTIDIIIDAKIVDFSLNGAPEVTDGILKNEPTDKEIDADVKLYWLKPAEDDQPLQPIWEGNSSYSVNGPSIDGQPIFTYPQYDWSVQGNPTYMPLPAGGDANDARPEGSVSQKHFSFNFGDDVATLPKSTTTSVIVTGNDANGNLDPKAPNLTGKVKINWHSPWGDGVDWGNLLQQRIIGAPGTNIDVPPYKDGNGNWVNPSQKKIEDINPGDTIYLPGDPNDPLIVTDKHTNSDGTTTLGYAPPPPPPLNEEDNLDAQIAAINAAYQEAIQVGAAGVKFGLTAYVEAGKALLTAPLFAVGGEFALSAVGKAGELLEQVAQVRRAEQYEMDVIALATEEQSKIRAIIQAEGKSPEEIAALNQKLSELDKLIADSSNQASTLHDIAAKGEAQANAIIEVNNEVSTEVASVEAGGPGGGGTDVGGIGTPSGVQGVDAEGNPTWFDGKLTGEPKEITSNMDEETARSYLRENEASYNLAKDGFEVKRLPENNPQGQANPDYEIRFPDAGSTGPWEIADCYAPSSNSVQNIISGIGKKVNTQGASTVVLNLQDSSVDLLELQQEIESAAQSGGQLENINNVVIMRDNGNSITVLQLNP